MNYFRQNSGQTNRPADPAMVHPYFPQQIMIHGYQPNEKQTMDLLVSFVAVWAPVFLAVWGVASMYGRYVKTLDKFTMMWFTTCGCLHVFFEGYFVKNHRQIGALQDIFAQLWKEYALSDSRYLTSDTFVLAAESMSVVFLGGLSWAMVYLICVSSPYRHPVQIIVCVGHLYSDLLYYATAMLDFYKRGVDYCRPEPYYFWVYYFGMNFIWIIVPAILLFQSVSIAAKAFAALDRMAKTLQGNGDTTNPSKF